MTTSQVNSNSPNIQDEPRDVTTGPRFPINLKVSVLTCSDFLSLERIAPTEGANLIYPPISEEINDFLITGDIIEHLRVYG